MVTLTVVTVVRDDIDGLRATLTSTAGQTLLPDEVVIVDSSHDRDAVPAVCRDHRTLPIDYSWNEPSGVYGAMNTALERVTSDYVYFLNAGDVFAGDAVLAQVVPTLDSTRPLWARGRVEFRGEDGTVLPEPSWSYAEERRHLFARGRFPAHQGVIVRTTDLRAEGGFDRTYSVAADYASILLLASREDPLELETDLAVFTTGGLSTQRWRTALQEFHRARREAFHPTGRAALEERAWTARSRAASEAYRLLWAPGRPLAGIVARGRPGGAG